MSFSDGEQEAVRMKVMPEYSDYQCARHSVGEFMEMAESRESEDTSVEIR